MLHRWIFFVAILLDSKIKDKSFFLSKKKIYENRKQFQHQNIFMENLYWNIFSQTKWRYRHLKSGFFCQSLQQQTTKYAIPIFNKKICKTWRADGQSSEWMFEGTLGRIQIRITRFYIEITFASCYLKSYLKQLFEFWDLLHSILFMGSSSAKCAKTCLFLFSEPSWGKTEIKKIFYNNILVLKYKVKLLNRST